MIIKLCSGGDATTPIQSMCLYDFIILRQEAKLSLG